MNRLLFFIGSLLILWGCSPVEPPKPENLIPQDKFVEILEDIHIGDAILSNLQRHNRKEKIIARHYYNSIYEKHDITREQFDQSMAYYAAQPEQLDGIHSQVVKNITEKKERLSEKNEKKDSNDSNELKKLKE